jgi:hypothetical protein
VTVAPPVVTDATARTIRVFVAPASLSVQAWTTIFLVFSDESSTEYALGESASIGTAPLNARTEARRRLAILRERAGRRVRLLPSYEETADEIAERSSEHEGLFEMQWRTRAWSTED